MGPHRLVQRVMLALCIALAACAPGVAARPGFGTVGFRHHVQTGTIVPTLAVTYDTSVGNGVDNNGRASLPLRAGAFRFYVNASTGSNSNTCAQAQSPSTPKATPKGAILCITSGEGDQVLIAQGQSFASGIYNLGGLGGFSAVYPTVIESYDPADPTNEAKLGASTSANRPVITVPGTDLPGAFISGSGTNYIAVRGLKFDGGGAAGVQMLMGVSSGGSNNYTLLENDDFASVQFSIQPANGAYPTLNQVFIVRSSSFHGAWATDGHGQGLYISGVDGFTLEDSAFIHAGWKDGALKTDPPSSGGPSMFGHPVYSQVDSINGIFRRNYFGQSPDDSGELKGGGIYQRNLAIGNPIGGWYGDGDAYSEYRPFGVYADGGYNAILSGGWCYETKDVNVVGLIHHNVCGQSDPTLGTAYGLMSDDGADLSPNAISLPTYPTWDHNTLYSWGASGNDHVSHISSSGGLLADIHATHTNNLWGDPTSGSNTNNSGTTFTNPYTGATLAVALGYADLPTAEAAWKADPQLHGWENGVGLALAGYNVIDPGLVDLNTNMALTAGYAIAGQFVGTHDGSTFTFASLPSGVTANGLCRCWHYDGTNTTVSSGTFTITETPPVGSPHTTTLPWSISARPVLSGLTITPGNASATVAVSSNTGSGKLFYGYSSTISASPTFAQLRSGVNADDSHSTGNPTTGNQTVSATGAQPTINLSSLTNGTTYYFSIAQLDGNNNPSITTTQSFVPTSSGAALLSSPTASGTSATTASLGVTTDTGSGTLYDVVSTSSTTPSAAQIEAGNDSTGSAAAAHGSQAVSATGVQSATASGLTASTTYYAYYVQHTTVDSNVVGSASFTTSASWTPASLGSNLVADLTKLDSSHLFQDTGCTTAVTTDGQTAKCIKDASSNAYTFTNSTGWVYHANSGHPYLAMTGSTQFASTTTVTFADANGVSASWHTVNLTSANHELVDINGVSSSNRSFFAACLALNTVSNARDSSNTLLAQDNLSNCPTATDAVFARVMTGTSGSGTVESLVNNAGDGSTAWTGSPIVSGTIYLSGAGNFYGAMFAKGDQSSNRSNAQTYMAGLHP